MRETLERLLASETFSRSERARNLIRYLVEREQAGDAERLKGYSIAMDVFGRDAGFDPSTDAVVRVQAGRLRELLAQYYATEGVSDPVRIVIPRGGYVPAYEPLVVPVPNPLGDLVAQAPVPAVVPAGFPAPPPVPQGGMAESSPPPLVPDAGSQRRTSASGAQLMRHLQLFWVAMGVVIAMLTFVVYRVVTPPLPAGDIVTAATGAPAAGETDPRATSDALPTIYIDARSADPDTTRVASVLRRALSGFDTVALVVHDDASVPVDEPDALDFVFEIAPGTDAGSVEIELQHRVTGKVLLARTLSSGEINGALEDQVATILSSTIPVSGIVYAHIEQERLQFGLTKCLLLNDDYYLDQTDTNHRLAYQCFETMELAGVKSPLIYSELAALQLEAATDNYAYPAGASKEQALATARRAVLMAPTSPYAHRAYGFLNSRLGNTEEAINWMKKAHELNTFDLSMSAAYGYALVMSGDYAGGVPIVQRAVELSSAHPSWWDYGLFLGQFMIGNMEGAKRASAAFTTTKRSNYLAARLVVASEAGDRAEAAALVDQIVDSYPKFAADPREAFARANYPHDMIEKFVKALRKAGLAGAS